MPTQVSAGVGADESLDIETGKTQGVWMKSPSQRRSKYRRPLTGGPFGVGANTKLTPEQAVQCKAYCTCFFFCCFGLYFLCWWAMVPDLWWVAPLVFGILAVGALICYRTGSYNLWPMELGETPDDAVPLPQEDADRLRALLQGTWQGRNEVHHVDFTVTVTGDKYSFSYISEETNEEETSPWFSFNFRKQPDGSLWFDDVGTKVIEGPSVTLIRAINSYKWRCQWRRHDPYAVRVYTSNPNTVNHVGPRPPVHPAPGSAPPVYTKPTAPSGAPVDVSTQLSNLNDLKQQGLMSQSEFEAAKARILA